MNDSKLIVIGGGSSNGKTEILEELERRGYPLYKEPAREFLEERKYILGQEKYDNPDYAENVYRQTEIYKLVTSQERIVKKIPGTNFIERSALEGIAFNEHLLGEVLPIVSQIPPIKLDLVFIPEKLDFQADGTRIEKSAKEAQTIHDSVIRTYFEAGYRPYLVPLMSGETKLEQIEKRADFVMRTSAKEGLLDSIYEFNYNSDWDERLGILSKLNQVSEKLHDKIYLTLGDASLEKVYNTFQLGELIRQTDPDIGFSKSDLNEIIATLENERILIELGKN